MLCGLSAGSLCWFADVVSAFNGPPRRVAGLGLLPFSNAVHYDTNAERARRRTIGSMSEGMLDGYAAADGAALHFVGRDLERVVTSRPQARAYRVSWSRGTGRGDRARDPLPRVRGAVHDGRCRLNATFRTRSGGSSPWAAAASRWSPRTPRSTTTC